MALEVVITGQSVALAAFLAQPHPAASVLCVECACCQGSSGTAAPIVYAIIVSAVFSADLMPPMSRYDGLIATGSRDTAGHLLQCRRCRGHWSSNRTLAHCKQR